jgi:hypothetical protein
MICKRIHNKIATVKWTHDLGFFIKKNSSTFNDEIVIL